MATAFVERLAELLGLPVEVVQAYGKPKRPVSLRAGRRKVGTVVDVEPPAARLMTLKTDSGAPPAEEEAPPNAVENELYEQWRDASAEEKPKLEQRLFDLVLKHAARVIWVDLQESNHDLAHNVASDAVRSLGTFEGESKFSTWVHAIAKKRILHELRTRTRRRAVFDEHADYEREVGRTTFDASGDIEAGILLKQMKKGLTSNESLLLDAMIEGLSTAEVAEKFGISEDAAESRQTRLRKKLIKNSPHRNGK